MKFSKLFVSLIVFSIMLRICLILAMSFSTQNADVYRYKDWAKVGYTYGVADTYKTDHMTFGVLGNNQPPGSVYLLTGAYALSVSIQAIFNHTFPQDTIAIFCLRLPALFADVGIGILIYLFVKKYSSETFAILGSMIFLCTPVVWYNSAVWGQMDSVNNFFFILALYLMYSSKSFPAMLSYAASLFIKLSVLPAAPIMAILFIKKSASVIRTSVYVGVTILSVIILTMPVSLQPYWLIKYFLTYSGGEMQGITNYAFNFWWVTFFPQVSAGLLQDHLSIGYGLLLNSPHKYVSLMMLSLSTWGYILFIIFLLPLLYILVKEKKEHKELEINLLALCLLLTFLFLPSMHDRYLYPVLPLLGLLVGYNKKYIGYLLFFSLINFLNIYIVWHLPSFRWIPDSISYDRNFQWILSVLTLSGGVLWYIDTIKTYKKVRPTA